MPSSTTYRNATAIIHTKNSATEITSDTFSVDHGSIAADLDRRPQSLTRDRAGRHGERGSGRLAGRAGCSRGTGGQRMLDRGQVRQVLRQIGAGDVRVGPSMTAALTWPGLRRRLRGLSSLRAARAPLRPARGPGEDVGGFGAAVPVTTGRAGLLGPADG